jgi:quinol monooxygenase YgiN
MSRVGLFVQLEAKPGKEKEVAEFLREALPLAEAEPHTLSWYAIKLGPSTFAIFDTFAEDSGRQEHLRGKIAAALLAKAPDLLLSPPSIEKADILAVKGNTVNKTAQPGAAERIPMQTGSELRFTNEGAITLSNPETELEAGAGDALLSYRFDAHAGEHVIRLLEPLANHKHMKAHRPGD